MSNDFFCGACFSAAVVLFIWLCISGMNNEKDSKFFSTHTCYQNDSPNIEGEK